MTEESEPPESFFASTDNLLGNPWKLCVTWGQWIQRFEVYLVETKKSSEPGPVQIQALISCLGPKGQEIYQRFHLPEDLQKDYEIIKEMFADYFKPKFREIVERFNFYSRTQGKNESFESFRAAVEELSKTCNFSDEEQEKAIRDRLIFGVKSKSARDEILNIDRPVGLIDVVVICSRSEANQQEKAESGRRRKRSESETQNNGGEKRRRTSRKVKQPKRFLPIEETGAMSGENESEEGTSSALTSKTISDPSEKRRRSRRKKTLPETPSELVVKPETVETRGPTVLSVSSETISEQSTDPCEPVHIVKAESDPKSEPSTSDANVGPLVPNDDDPEVNDEDEEDVMEDEELEEPDAAEEDGSKAAFEEVKAPTNKCSFCDTEFRYPSQLVNHARKHTNERPFLCSVCGKAFREKGSMKKHGLRVHKLGEKKFCCAICPSKYFTRHLLELHMRSHSGDKPYACQYCPSRFASISYLKNHERRHSGERPHVCTKCPMAFVDSGDLQRHQKSHSREKPYSCTICNMRFRYLNSLRQHEKLHSGVKPFACNMCSATFARKYYLKQHLVTHTGDKPWACKLCPAKFTQSSSLRQHEKKHTAEKQILISK